MLCALEILRYYGVEMIRKFGGSDIDPVLDIWLSASIKAHDFVEASFWKSQVENMRNIYIPASETYVFESNSKVVGFIRLTRMILQLSSFPLSFKVGGLVSS